MGFALLPLFLLVFWMGLSNQQFGLAQAVPGAGLAGQMQSIARVRGQQAAVYGQACEYAASSAPGLISASIAVTLPSGVAAPAGAFCMTTANGSGRNIYAVIPLSTPGSSSQANALTQYNAAWWRVTQGGLGSSMTSGVTQPLPATIPAPSLVDWTQINF